MTDTPVPPPAPVRADDRIVSLDLIRGFAVLGILAVNAMMFFWPMEVGSNHSLQPGWSPAAADAWQVMDVFFRDKMRTLFSMLFGVSIFLVGGERADRARGRLLRSRLFWLAAFGVVHGALFWYGDILLLYALTGFVVLLMRSWPARTLLLAGAGVYVLLCLIYVGAYAALRFAPPEVLQQQIAEHGWAASPERIARIVGLFQGDALSTTWNQFRGWTYAGPVVAVTFLPITASLMLIGMGLFKAGFLAGRSPSWVYGVAVAAGAVALVLMWRETAAVRAGGFEYLPAITRPWGSLLGPVVSLGYAGGLMLLLRVGLKRLLHPLICAGRMAFTNYLTQTLIMTTLAYGGRGFGLYGEIGWPEMWGVIAAVWLVQLVWSPIWLHFFRMGPIEWVWRRLTYGRGLPLRRGLA
jgi:uncharacterized protein